MPLYVIDQFVDVRGLGHDAAMRRTSDAFRGLASGQTAEVLATDPETLHDLVGWAAGSRVEIVEATVDHGRYRFVLRRT